MKTELSLLVRAGSAARPCYLYWWQGNVSVYGLQTWMYYHIFANMKHVYYDNIFYKQGSNGIQA